MEIAAPASPEAAETPKNMNYARGANEQAPVIRENNQAIGKIAASLGRHKRFECGALQRRVSEFIPSAVSPI